MSFADKSELKAAIKFALEAAIEKDKQIPADMDVFEYMQRFPCKACGHRIEPSDAQHINSIDRNIQDAIDRSGLLPERQRPVVRAILGHLEVCQWSN